MDRQANDRKSKILVLPFMFLSPVFGSSSSLIIHRTPLIGRAPSRP
ncbi:MAG: hypothetical protein ACI87E_004742 [Mariniblastus sp.]|jgi:hypothetical protein